MLGDRLAWTCDNIVKLFGYRLARLAFRAGAMRCALEKDAFEPRATCAFLSLSIKLSRLLES
jgi:hypothetical protein